MKRDKPTKQLRLKVETIRKLTDRELETIAGGSNNGCESGITSPSLCRPCVE
jgi:hypothetical protein